jgi:hypothetical protein
MAEADGQPEEVPACKCEGSAVSRASSVASAPSAALVVT